MTAHVSRGNQVGSEPGGGLPDGKPESTKLTERLLHMSVIYMLLRNMVDFFLLPCAAIEKESPASGRRVAHQRRSSYRGLLWADLELDLVVGTSVILASTISPCPPLAFGV